MTVAVDNSLPALLASLQSSLEAASKALPDPVALLPKDGISLLDVKNELFLSYLHNLVFFILLKLRRCAKREQPAEASLGSTANELDDNLDREVVKKLVELRVYLEKGVRPLEGRLRYQVDKVVRAADDAARITSQKFAINGSTSRQAAAQSDSDESDSPSESRLDQGLGSEGDSTSREEIKAENDQGLQYRVKHDDLAYRPNPASFQPAQQREKVPLEDSIYRPPRIMPTALPTPTPREGRTSRKPQKSTTLDEYIATELSNAPIAEPSIGTTIISGGRKTKSHKERREEEERRIYEEANFVRLPKDSKKERARKARQGRVDQYGGEEWKDLGAGLDRIERLTHRKTGSSSGLERSRKRAVEDGPRSSGAEAGERFEKRRKTLVRSRRK